MADVILACVPAGRGQVLPSRRAVSVAAARLRPSNMPPQEPTITEADGLIVAVANESGGGVSTGPNGVLLGATIGTPTSWDAVGADAPDGSFALVRHTDRTLQAITDITATRTLWYAFDEERFLLSSSQRALTVLLGDLDLNQLTVAWMLSSGTLGPGNSWDSRIHALPADSVLTLDRTGWRLTVDRQPAFFEPVARSSAEHHRLLHEALQSSCRELDIDEARWVLPLSGGVDSRAILAYMAKASRQLRCVTWTTRSSLRNPLSDAFIAQRAARRFRAPHSYLYLDPRHEPLVSAFDRFVAVGEGRIDEFAGYVDGCVVWRDLAASGVGGIVRGDESFGGGRLAASAAAARHGAGGTMVTDVPDDHVLRQLGLVEQEWPDHLHRRPEETIKMYYDRIEQENYLPYVLAALTELKGRYLDVVNPLLSRRIIQVVRTLSDHERRHSRAWHALVDPAARPIPYARFSSTPDSSAYLEDEGIVAVMVHHLTSDAIGPVVTEEGAMLLLAAMASPGRRGPVLRRHVVAAMKAARVALPYGLAARLTPRYRGEEPPAAATLAFRATIASKMIALLHGDAGALRKPAGPSPRA